MTRTQYLCFLLVEDPSDEFTRIRDFVDAKNCLKLGSFSKEKLHQGFSAEMIEEAQRELKINKVSVCFFVFCFLFFRKFGSHYLYICSFTFRNKQGEFMKSFASRRLALETVKSTVVIA